jgi:hypothetical protein
VGAVIVGIPAAYIIAAGGDTHDADRSAQIMAAHRAGVQAGRSADMCWGLRVDARSGEAIK